jgi:hypothetical protein
VGVGLYGAAIATGVAASSNQNASVSGANRRSEGFWNESQIAKYLGDRYPQLPDSALNSIAEKVWAEFAVHPGFLGRVFRGETTAIPPQDDRKALMAADEMVHQQFPGVKAESADGWEPQNL